MIRLFARRENQLPMVDDGGKRARLTGEHEVSRKPLRREGRMLSAEPVCSCALSFVQIARETAGAARIRLSLRPLFSKRVNSYAKLGHVVPRECGRTFDVGNEWTLFPRHCERSEAIHLSACCAMDCFASARNDG